MKITESIKTQKQAESNATQINIKYNELKSTLSKAHQSANATPINKHITKETIENSLYSKIDQTYYQIRDQVTNFQQMLKTSKNMLRRQTNPFQTSTLNTYSILKSRIDKSGDQMKFHKYNHTKKSLEISPPTQNVLITCDESLVSPQSKEPQNRSVILPQIEHPPSKLNSILREDYYKICTPNAERLLAEADSLVIEQKSTKSSNKRCIDDDLQSFDQLCREKRSLTRLKERVMKTVKNENKRERQIKKFFDLVSKKGTVPPFIESPKKVQLSPLSRAAKNNISTTSSCVHRDSRALGIDSNSNKSLIQNSTRNSLQQKVSLLLTRMNPLVSINKAAEIVSEKKSLLANKLYKKLNQREKSQGQCIEEKKKLLLRHDTLSTNSYNLPHKLRLASEEKTKLIKANKLSYNHLLLYLYSKTKGDKLAHEDAYIIDSIKELIETLTPITPAHLANIAYTLRINSTHPLISQSIVEFNLSLQEFNKSLSQLQ